MQKVCAAILLGLLVYTPFGHNQPAVVETNTNIQSTAPAGHVSVVPVPDVALVHATVRVEVPHSACAVETTGEATFVQQTADLKALFVCGSLALGHVAEVADLPVVTSPVGSVGVAIALPTREFVGPTVAPWYPGAQVATLVVPVGFTTFREVVIARPQAARASLLTHGVTYESVKTLAELGFMLC
ncbi:MAG: hypothetical protein JNK33_06345 [Candidatus Doudnabacteria bacterium]|nr:hypothetical protein [Candidatus Doudnabacteria bacterium]